MTFHLSLTYKFDVIGLLETWADSENEYDSLLSSHTHFSSVRNKSRNAIRNSGGVSVCK